MKKLVFLVVAAALMSVFAGSSVNVSATTITGLVDTGYDFEYVISEIGPSLNAKKGSFVVKNNNTEYPDNKIYIFMYRLDDGRDPYSILYPDMVRERKPIYEVAQVPAYADTSVRLDVASGPAVYTPEGEGLVMGDTANMEFYYSVAIMLPAADGVGLGSIRWIGTRKASYADCARAAEYKEGVVCKLSKQVDGVFYYDAYVGGVLVGGTEIGGEAEGVHEENRVADEKAEGSVIREMVGKNNIESNIFMAAEIVKAGGAIAKMGGDPFKIAFADEVRDGGGTGSISNSASAGGVNMRMIDWMRLAWLPPTGVLAVWLFVWLFRRRKDEKKRERFAKYARIEAWKY
ncbi:hypothetical protein FWF89_02695 [Candidatus Saccharibacteria bacterium]|nr:hypothetical protein [Candidatus Saccharibacteria bacterium]